MKDNFVNILFWIGFGLTAMVAAVGAFIGLGLLCVVGVACIILGTGSILIAIIPCLPFICWCAMFERQRWESFIRMIQHQKPAAN
jgi:hypothetical protein